VDLTDARTVTDLLRAAADRLSIAVGEASADQLATIAHTTGRRWSRETRPAPLAPLAQLAVLRSLDVRTPLVLRPGLHPTLRRTGDRLSLGVIDTTIGWPAAVQEALQLAISAEPFRPGDLPNLDPTEQLVLARRLLREGVVVPTEFARGPGD
jgi:hypothetical protein